MRIRGCALLAALGSTVACSSTADTSGSDVPTRGDVADVAVERGDGGDAEVVDQPQPDDAPPADVSVMDATVMDVGLDQPDVAPPDRVDGTDVVAPTDRTDATDVVDSGPPPVCPTPVEVVVYNQGAWMVLGEAFRDDPSPCADYYLSIAAVSADHTLLRGAVETNRIHALGPRFHAMAEFSWSGWAAVTGMTWYEKGVEFRRRMVAAGYDPARDTWELNELPSTSRTNATVRQNIRDAVRGLFEGPPGSPTMRGAVFIIGHGQGAANVAVYKSALEGWLEDAPFWVDMNRYARWWAQESYANPLNVCVTGDTVAQRASHTNDFFQHVGTLAYASNAPAGVATARSYLSRTYVPVANGVWQSSVYNTASLTLPQMQNFISGQLYATRAWASSHPYPDGRVSLAWDHADTATADEERALAARIASAIHHAYGNGGGDAAHACSPSGAYTFCQCMLSGAAYNTLWQGFTMW